MANRLDTSRAAKNTPSPSGKARVTSKVSNPKGRNARRAAATAEESQRDALLDAKTKQIILGIILCVIALAVFVGITISQPGLASELIFGFIRQALGIGAYILPFVLAIVGVSLIIKPFDARISARVALGLVLLFLAVLGLISLFVPGAAQDSAAILFDADVLASFGGYLGSSIAWVGITLLGQAISCIVLVGLGTVGIVVTGFSLRGFLAHLLPADKSDENDESDSVPSARMYRQSILGIKKHHGDQADDTARQPTQMLSRARRTQKGHAIATEGAVQVGEFTNHNTAHAPQAITRKLGSNLCDSHTPQKETTPISQQASSVKTPVAAPHPQDGFVLPPMNLLTTTKDNASSAVHDSELADTAAELEETLENFGIMADVLGWIAGPTVTLFKVDLPPGVRVSRITALNDDIALALAAPGVRIFAPIPGTNYVGIEVPNRVRQTVLLGDVLKDAPEGPLQIAIGKDVEGNSIVSDLAKMPHLLIGGTTGSGKSVSVNAMVMSILMRATPAEVRFIMIDPKRVEFTPYNGIPHLYVPVVTEAREAASALSWGVAEMERRLKVFSKVGARNIGQYNAKCQANLAAASDDKPIQEPNEELPYIVIIIDELADLMMNVGKEVEFSISRIAQLARAAGIHLIVATQRPSTNVVTGLIKANITNRIAFNVASGIDSRVILDTPGAENLIGLGDLLLSKPELAKPQRIQGCYVSEDEINAVVDTLKEQGEPDYHGEILNTNLITVGMQDTMGSSSGSSVDDPLLWEAAEIVVSSGFGSTSGIQRRLKVGYSRAGRIMDMLEEKGVVGPPNGSKPRDVLVDAIELETLKAFELRDDVTNNSSTEG